MLDTNIQTLANDHATALQARGLQVTAIAGTPVAELVAYCRTGETACVTVMEDFNATVEGLADKVADFMRGYLDFARNTAKPALQSLQENVAETILKTTESDKVFNPFTGFDIVRIGAPDVLEDSDFLASVAHYNSGNDKVPNTAPKYGHRSNEQLIELCMTGNGAWDALIKTWLTGLEEGALQTVWQSVFMDKVINAPSAPIKTTEALLQDYTQGGFSALVLFLMASRVQQNIDDEFGHSLDTARQFLYAVQQACAVHVERGINWFNSYVSTSSLVVGMDRQARKIKVNTAVYKQFLADGGKADVLMGMLVSGRSYSNLADISAHAEELLQVWSQYVLSRDGESQAALDTHLRTVMGQAFEASLATPVGDLETEQLAKPGVKETAINRFHQLLSGYTSEQLRANWADVLWRCACQARFYYHTTTYDLLDAIDAGVRLDGRDPQDAATVAVQKIVPSFVAEMLRATPASV